MFDFNFLTLFELLFPTFMRVEPLTSWLRILLTPLQELKELFDAFRQSSSDKLVYHFQVIYMEKLLNDTFNPNGSSPIYIEDVDEEINPTFLFRKSEGGHKSYLYHKNEVEHTPAYLYHKSEFMAQNDFVINVPQVVYDDLQANATLPQMYALINFYKMAGKKYIIQSY